MGSPITIRGLRHDEWEGLRAVRLEAATNHPRVFRNSSAATLKVPKAEWHRRIDSPTSRIFGLFDGDVMIGITGIYIPDEASKIGVLVMNYIKPKYCGQGLSKLFYDIRIQWALEKALTTLQTDHRIGNDASKRAILARGFRYIGTEEMDWPDGSRDLEEKYELDLAGLRN